MIIVASADISQKNSPPPPNPEFVPSQFFWFFAFKFGLSDFYPKGEIFEFDNKYITSILL